MNRGVLAALIFLSIGVMLLLPAWGQEDIYSVFLNGTRFQVTPVERDNIVYLPVQAFASKLQLSFEWNSKLNTIKINDQIVNARPLALEGILYLPVESMAQAINAVVKWDSRKKRILIDVPDSPLAASYQAGAPGNRVGAVVPVPSAGSQGNRVGAVVPAPAAGSQGNRDGAVVPAPAQGSQGNQQAILASARNKTEQVNRNATIKITRLEENVGAVLSNNAQGKQVPSNLQPLNTTSIPLEQGSSRNSYETPGKSGLAQMPQDMKTFPSPSAYPGTGNENPSDSPIIHPMNAPPTMPAGLQLPPSGPQFPGSIQDPQMPAELTSTPAFPQAGNFVSKNARNQVFSVTVTNMEQLNSIKNYYKPNAGSKYVVIYISQQNVSEQVQIYTGKFSLSDENNKIYEYQEGLSNFWLVILKPGAINYGYLVFEVPDYVKPERLILHAMNQSPLTLKLD
ncbi:MAG: DUF4352 domain-containing protein [Candidatus Eremiobacteraeota bacterium]|nr:DUF4352 domain-containing protein [Candidatus Eremiobacteraeota bacterium]